MMDPQFATQKKVDEKIFGAILSIYLNPSNKAMLCRILI